MTAPIPETAEHEPRHSAPDEPAKPGRWKVVLHVGGQPDTEVCRHRWNWTAELHAHWLESHDRHRVGVHYIVYPAEVKP